MFLTRLEGTVNRYRKLDMTVGEKEMVIAELQAKYVSMIIRVALCFD